jgi:FAD:protein FMN transferase
MWSRRISSIIVRHALIVAVRGTLCIMLMCAVSCTHRRNSVREYQRHFIALDTAVDITVYSTADPAPILGEVQQSFAAFDSLISISNSDSDTWKINHRQGPTVSVSPLTVNAARFSLQECSASHGLFDITVAPLKYLYGLESHQEKHRIPTPEELDRIRSVIGCRHFRVLNDTQLSLDDGVTLDFGGIAKGFLMAKVRDMLVRPEIKGFLINIGGDILVWGTKPKDQPWKIGVRDPRGEDGELIGALNASNSAVFTSGDYERYFVKDGVRYHHIFNPLTLLPARYNRSATVVGGDSAKVDTSVKSAFCMPARQAIDYLRVRHLSGIVVDSDGAVWVSRELRPQFESAVPASKLTYR